MIGRLSAASTSATIDGADDSDVISQPAPMSCIHVPRFETIVASHRLRKRALRSGLHALADADVSGVAVSQVGVPASLFPGDQAATIRWRASRPSVSAAGPGCRMSGDLISCSSPSRTAGTRMPTRRAPPRARVGTSCRTTTR